MTVEKNRHYGIRTSKVINFLAAKKAGSLCIIRLASFVLHVRKLSVGESTMKFIRVEANDDLHTPFLAVFF